jgi:hypothetical protein
MIMKSFGNWNHQSVHPRVLYRWKPAVIISNFKVLSANSPNLSHYQIKKRRLLRTSEAKLR